MSDLSLSQSLLTHSASRDALGINSALKSDVPPASRVTLDNLLISKPVSTVIYPVRNLSAAKYGLKIGDLLIVDREAVPHTDQLVIISINDELSISRYSGFQYQSNLASNQDRQTNLLFIWGAVTYIISKQS